MKFIIFFLLIPLTIFSHDPFVSAFKSFKLGIYQDSIVELKKIKSFDKKIRSIKYYFLGISYARLQSYDEAVKNLEISRVLKNESKDIHYELGQAYYATNDLYRAKRFFLQSANQGYKEFICYYYIAYIYQIFDEYEKAKIYYKKTIDSEEADIRTQQASFYQLGDALYSSSQKKDTISTIVSKQVIPLFQKSIDMDTSNVSFVNDIKNKIIELQRRYNLNSDIVAEGKIYRGRRWSGHFEKKFSYDDNITLKNDLPATIPSQENSFISQSQLYGQYKYPINNSFLITPRLRFQYIHHFERDNPDVYQNDTYLINPGIFHVYKTTIFKKNSDIHFLYNYKYIGRDRLRQKKKVFYARAHQYSLGQRISLFEFGPTNFKMKYKQYNAFSDANNNETYTLSFNQSFFLPNRTVFIIFHQSDFIHFENDFYSFNNFTLRFDWIIPNSKNTHSFQLYHSFGLLDTIKQRPIRGYEKLFTVGIKFSKKITRKMSINPSYFFLKNISKNTFYKYKKHNISIDFKVNF